MVHGKRMDQMQTYQHGLEGLLPKLTDWAKKETPREEVKRPMISLEKLQDFTPQLDLLGGQLS